MKFLSYDDEGVIYLGTKEECFKSIVDLCQVNGELQGVYKRNELYNIQAYFRNKHNLKYDNFEYSGFKIAPYTKELFNKLTLVDEPIFKYDECINATIGK